MSIYNHSSYREYLKEILSSRIESNSSYSLRAMARSLNISPSTLSEVMSGKLNLSRATAKKIGSKLNLKLKEISYFCELIEYESLKDPELREQALERMRTLHPKKRKVSDLSLEHFRQMADWYHAAILELPLLPEFDLSIENIAKTLRISKPQADLAVGRLIKLGLLDRDEDGAITRQQCDYSVRSDVKNAAMRQYYNQMLSKISTALEEQTPKERLSGYLNIPFSKKGLEKADKAIDRFILELKNIAEEEKNPDCIYHLSLHFINLMKEKEK